MMEWIQKTLALWPAMLAAGAARYLQNTLIGPALGAVPMGSYIAQGFGDVAAVTATQTSYFMGGAGGMGMGAFFGGNGAGSSNVPSAAVGGGM